MIKPQKTTSFQNQLETAAWKITQAKKLTLKTQYFDEPNQNPEKYQKSELDFDPLRDLSPIQRVESSIVNQKAGW